MAYNETLSFRIEKTLLEKGVLFETKKMFGGLAFMINDKMCIGVMKDEIMLRVMEEFYEDLLEQNHVKPMNFTGKTMRGMLFIESEGFQNEVQLSKWIAYGLDFAERGVLKSKKKK